MNFCRTRRRERGIALILVLIAVVVLAVLAAGFGYAMRVEVKLARNASGERELEWLGRSGVELARYVVGQQMMIGAEPYDSLNQKWAGGPGGFATSNSPLAEIQLENVEIGSGRFSIKIVDSERRMNINLVTDPMLQQALTLAGLDAAGAQTVASSILDWIDTDDAMHVSGAESEYYKGSNPPYEAKNGPIDDLSELLLIKGIDENPEILWGASSTNRMLAAFQEKAHGGTGFGDRDRMPSFGTGLAELFMPVGSGKINVNTASPAVLQMIPGMDENMAQEVIRLRAGPDGADGTEDDTPLRNVGELVNAIPSRPAVQAIMQFCDVRSRVFEVTVEAEINGYKRSFVALIARNSARDIPILAFGSK